MRLAIESSAFALPVGSNRCQPREPHLGQSDPPSSDRTSRGIVQRDGDVTPLMKEDGGPPALTSPKAGDGHQHKATSHHVMPEAVSKHRN